MNTKTLFAIFGLTIIGAGAEAARCTALQRYYGCYTEVLETAPPQYICTCPRRRAQLPQELLIPALSEVVEQVEQPESL